VAGSSRRDSILDAAISEFAVHGLSGARIERVAASARSNKQLIFHYFGSKDGLYAAAVAHMFSTAPAAGPTGASPPEAMRRRVDEIVAWFAGTRGAAVAMTECTGGTGVPEAAIATITRWREQLETSLSSLLDDGQRQGHFRDDIDAQALVGLILGATVGYALLARGSAAREPRPSGFAALLGQAVVDHCEWR
jgi:AcrR family transcriptional regulator